jgi:hypothetical protein
VNVLRAIALALVAALGAPCAAGAQGVASPSPAPATVSVVGQVLSAGSGYLVFTTGDALRLDSAVTLPKGLRLGQTVRALIDARSHAITSLILEPKALLPADIDATKIPREFVVASPGSTRTGALLDSQTGAAVHGVTVTINVRVPDNTPITDDVYLATDRTNFSPAEIRMIRMDARTWSVSVQIASGTQLRYEFTRGNFANIERDKLGSIVNPRTITAADNLQTHDAVAHWADIN